MIFSPYSQGNEKQKAEGERKRNCQSKHSVTWRMAFLVMYYFYWVLAGLRFAEDPKMTKKKKQQCMFSCAMSWGKETISYKMYLPLLKQLPLLLSSFAVSLLLTPKPWPCIYVHEFPTCKSLCTVTCFPIIPPQTANKGRELSGTKLPSKVFGLQENGSFITCPFPPFS